MRKPQTVELSLAVENSQPKLGLGERLRVTREKLDWSIDEVAEQLCLCPGRIEDLERDEFSHMAGATYARGYLRNYARLLKLDSDEVIHQYEQMQGANDRSSQAPLIEPLIEGNLPHHRDSAARYIGLLLILALLMVGGWWWQSERIASNPVVDSAAIDQPSAAAVIVSAEPGTSATADSFPSTVTDGTAGVDTVNTFGLAAESLPARGAAESPATESIDESSDIRSVIASESIDSVNTTPVRKPVADEQIVSASAPVNSTSEPPAEKTTESSLVAQTRQLPPKKMDKSKKAVPAVTSPPATNQSVAQKSIEKLASTPIPGKSKTVQKPHKPKQTVSKTLKRSQEKTGSKNTTKMPRLLLTDDLRTLMLYFDLGSWVDIRDTNGKRLLNRMVVQGRTLSVQGTPPFKIFLGNRQGVRIIYRGKPVQVKDNGTGMFARFTVGKPLVTIVR